jgi:hypothetical protein
MHVPATGQRKRRGSYICQQHRSCGCDEFSSSGLRAFIAADTCMETTTGAMAGLRLRMAIVGSRGEDKPRSFRLLGLETSGRSQLTMNSPPYISSPRTTDSQYNTILPSRQCTAAQPCRCCSGTVCVSPFNLWTKRHIGGLGKYRRPRACCTIGRIKTMRLFIASATSENE